MGDGIQGKHKEGDKGTDPDVPELSDLLGEWLIEKEVEDDHKGTRCLTHMHTQRGRREKWSEERGKGVRDKEV